MRWDTTYDYPLVVQFEDVDYQRVVHHPNYLKYFERARVAAMEQEGTSFLQLLSEGSGLVVADVRLAYRQPMVFGRSYVVQSRLAAVSSASFRVRQIVHEGRAEDCASVRAADVDDWDQAVKFCALGDVVLVHVQLPGSPTGRDSGDAAASTAPLSPHLLKLLGVQMVAGGGGFDAASKALLRSNKVRLK